MLVKLNSTNLLFFDEGLSNHEDDEDVEASLVLGEEDCGDLLIGGVLVIPISSEEDGLYPPCVDGFFRTSVIGEPWEVKEEDLSSWDG